jgi:ABC-type spermidine/putrescine transport system permease subunit I
VLFNCCDRKDLFLRVKEKTADGQRDLRLISFFKTITGMILIQVAYYLSFSTLLYRSFISTIPHDLDEAALIDGAKPWQIFFRVILPLLAALDACPTPPNNRL